MGKHLDRLKDRIVFEISKNEDGTFEISEISQEYDRPFTERFSAEELRELAQEIIEMSYS